MSRVYTGDLVDAALLHARTADGLLHTGALFRPADGTASQHAVLWLRGGGQHFAYPSYLCIGRALARHGHGFLSANTRGHDLGSQLAVRGGRAILGGTWWERLDESPLDLAAWIDCLADLGFARVVLAGHSLAGWKAASYQAQRRDPRVRGLVIASTPVRPPNIALLDEQPLLARAECMVAVGRGDALLVDELARKQSASSLLALARLDLDLYGMHQPVPL